MRFYFYPRSPCGERRNFWNESSVLRLFLSTLSLRRATYWATRARAAQLFLSTLSLRRATICDLKTAKKGITFLSTLSLRRATGRVLQDITPAGISIHALLAESDLFLSEFLKVLFKFLSTLSLRRATKAIIECNGGDPISIHALLAESDLPGQVCLLVVIPFLSTLSLRRATCPKASAAPPLMQFLSTLSLRRATTRPCMRRTVEPDFYPRSPCGERHYFCKDHYAAVSISIHALLAESDHPARHSTIPCGNFYPRSPCGERPSWASMFALTTYISIHALLAESDFTLLWDNNTYGTFLSTLSLRRATGHGDAVRHRERHFYPRSPCGERPQHWPCSQSHHPHFYPRSPCGERRSGAS